MDTMSIFVDPKKLISCEVSLEDDNCVWTDAEMMRSQLEQKLKQLLKAADVDRDGFVSREEFKQIVISHFRHRNGMTVGESIYPTMLSQLETSAKKQFKVFDKDKNRRLDVDELREYLKSRIDSDVLADVYMGSG